MPAEILAGFVVSGNNRFEVPMSFWLGLIVVLALIVAFIAIFGAEDRHAKMTEEEFEEEAKRSSAIGAGVVELHKVFQPSRVKQYLEEKNRVKEESSFSGDPPRGLPIVEERDRGDGTPSESAKPR
ncbi:MAG TPA: hypothetical protein VN774_04845 [Candidatus Limnocylindrales bacterium]|nr:hypothetical protein [Candidatus Limnocylindrales bacterium]